MVHNLYWMWNNEVDPAFCDFVISSIDWYKSAKGSYTSGSGKSSDPVIRDTDVVFAPPMHPVAPLLEKYIMRANAAAGWGYDIVNFQDPQLGRYGTGGHYDWHADTAVPDCDNFQRKLSAVLLLNDEFSGGDLEFEATQDKTPLKTKGSVIVFPSFLKHRVLPVTSGVRYSAVSWAMGPAFK
jgi:PKHD-type hydroxylase